MKRSLIPALTVVLLTGCQASSAPPVTYGAASRVAVVRHAQYQGAAQSLAPPPPAVTLTANSDRLSFDQEGDAVELLDALARLRGLAFSYSGVRLPLPVSLHVRDMTWENVLRLVRAQTAWRASVSQMPGLLHLSFMPPEPARK